MHDEGTGDGELDGVGLSVKSSASADGLDVKRIAQIGHLKGLEKLALKGEGGENVLERLLVDGDFTGSFSHPNSGDSSFAATGGSVGITHGCLKLEGDRLWLLGFVRVGVTSVNLELFHLGGTKLVLGNHAFDSPLEDELGATLADLGRSLNGLTADVTGVTGVDFVLFLGPGEAGVFGIDDDDEVTGINVRREDRLVLSAEETGCLHGDFTDDLVLGINDVPGTLDVSWFC